MMLHDFRDVILGRPGRDAAIEGSNSRFVWRDEWAFQRSNTISMRYERWAATGRAQDEANLFTRRTMRIETKTSNLYPISESIQKLSCGNATHTF